MYRYFKDIEYVFLFYLTKSTVMRSDPYFGNFNIFDMVYIFTLIFEVSDLEKFWFLCYLLFNLKIYMKTKTWNIPLVKYVN